MLESLRFSQVRVLCLGDVMLDRFVAGQVKRISPEGPVAVMAVTSETCCAGGAANVARNVAALGAHCTIVGVLGLDANGETLKNILHDCERVAVDFIELPNRPTTTKTRFLGQNQQMLRVDREVSSPLLWAEEGQVIDRALRLLPDHDLVVLSDYAKGMLGPRVCKAIIERAQTLGKPVIVDPKTADLSRYAGASVVTPNQKEAQEVTGLWADTDADAEQVAERILSEFEIEAVLLTRAERGMTLQSRGAKPTHISSEAREVFDVVGAGDTVIATLAVVLGSGATLESAARIANTAAGIVVGKSGTATVSAGELHDALTQENEFGSAAPGDKIFNFEEIRELASDWQADGMKVGFTNGCFDILHVGHIRLLQFARKSCDRLIVGINSDASVKRLKGPSRPINSEADRAELLGAMSFVDAVVVFDEDTPGRLIETAGPDVLVKGADYTIDKIVGADFVLGRGGKVLRFEIVPGKSTTATIKRSQGN